MITRYLLAAALLLITGSRAFSQTALVAHRSHSGSDAAFTFLGADNFGNPPSMPPPPPAIDTVIKVSDTSVIICTGGERLSSVRHPVWCNPRMTREGLQKLYPGIVFIGYDPPKKTGRRVRKCKPVSEMIAPASAPRTAFEHAGGLALAAMIAVPLVAAGIRRSHRRRAG